jgi:hypothetical protein
MAKKYEILLVMEGVSILDTEAIINLEDQGWEFWSSTPIHSFAVDLCRETEVETDAIEMYVKAFNKLNANVKIVSYIEKATRKHVIVD